MDVDRALVVHGDGLDEIGLHGETTVAEVDGDTVEEYVLTPEDIGVGGAPVEEVAGGSPRENARDLRRVFEGEETGAKRDIVLANSGAALYVAGVADGIEDGVEAARNAVVEGEAVRQLRALAETQ